MIFTTCGSVSATAVTMTTGNFFFDESVLRDTGVTDFDRYAVSPGTPLFTDLFVES